MIHTGVGPVAHAPELTPLTWSQALTAWRVDVPMLLVLAVLGGGYAVGLARLRRDGHEWSVGRTIVYYTGLLFFTLVTMSFIGRYELTLFWTRAVQNVTLLMIVPLLLAWGMPVTLLVRTTGGFGEFVLRVIRSRPAQVLTFPGIVSLILLTTPYLLYFTGWYELTLRHAFFNESLHVELMAIGFLYFWSRLRVDPVPREYPHLVSVWITFVEAIADGGLGLLLWLGRDLVAGQYYASLNLHWAPDLRWDQAFGGGAIWFIGDLSGVPFIGALWSRLMKEDRDEAERYEREFELADAAEALEAALNPSLSPGGDEGPGAGGTTSAGKTTSSGGATGAGSPRPSGAQVTVSADDPSQRRYRPWWETDPVLGARYGFREPE